MIEEIQMLIAKAVTDKFFIFKFRIKKGNLKRHLERRV